MQLAPGTRLGPYEIVARLGAGGMGEVWRARDTRLDRTVAVKILPADFAHDAQLRIRFEREARAISQLNHPHICTVHDVGKENGIDYLVMELLEGESLAERLARGPLPLGDVLRYGVQIAEALDRAHRSGIIHRDLKPGNVMITKAGAKLLDFGLARSVAPPNAVTADTPTAHMPLTSEGIVVGTLQYMAPEQLAGDEADHRTDLFALGAVLYEMTTGRPAFEGRNRTSLVAAIMSGEPPRITELQPLTPPALEHLITRCLAKDPDDRWQSAHDIADQLRWIGETGSQPRAAAAPRRTNRLAAIAAAVLLAATAFLAWQLWRERAKPLPVRRTSIVPPPGQRFVVTGQDAAALTISPDGRWVTYAVGSDEGDSALWLQSLETGAARRIGRGHSPFWSPDSRSLGFYGDGRLERIAVAGGPAVPICETRPGRGGAWGADDTIVFEPLWQSPLHRVSANGGKSAPLTVLDAKQNETTHRWPSFLPDGRHFLYLAGSHQSALESTANAIYVASVDEPGKRRLLLRSRANAIHAGGYVLFVRENDLLAQPLDVKTLALTGDPVPLAQNVATAPAYFRAEFGASQDGTLVYVAGPSRGKRTLEWRDVAGKTLQHVATLEFDDSLRLSPDGKRVAVTIGEPGDIWIIDLERMTRTRFTTEDAREYAPVWSPDGSRIIYTADREAHAKIYEKAVDGLSPQRTVRQYAGSFAVPTDWSRDGRYLVTDVEGATGRDIWVTPLDGSGEPYPLVATPFAEGNALFSPDGRWVIYQSDETGQLEAYVLSFPDRRIRKQLTSTGALGIGWLDAHTIVTGTREGWRRIAVNGDSFGRPEPFTAALPGLINLDFAPDGKRVLVLREEPAEPVPITIVTNWPRLVSTR